MSRTGRQQGVVAALALVGLALSATGCARRPPCAVDPRELASVERAALATEIALEAARHERGDLESTGAAAGPPSGAFTAAAPPPANIAAADPRDCDALAAAYHAWEARLEAVNTALMEEQMAIVRLRARAGDSENRAR